MLNGPVEQKLRVCVDAAAVAAAAVIIIVYCFFQSLLVG